MSKQQAIADIAKKGDGVGATLRPDGELVPTTWREVARPKTVAYVDQYNADVAARREADGGDATRSDLLKRAYANGGNHDLKYEIASARLLSVNAGVYARTVMTSAFFETVSLKRGDNGVLGVRNNWGRQITARWIGREEGELGGRISTQLVESLKLIPFQCTWFKSDWVEYPTDDLEQGDLHLDAWVKAQVERRYAVRYDVESGLIRNSLLFTSGIAANFEADPEVDATTIPDKNNVDMTGVGGVFSFAVMLYIKNYALRFGMTPTNLFFNVMDSNQFYTIPSFPTLLSIPGFNDVAPQMVIPQGVRDEWFRDSQVVNFLGAGCKINWVNTTRANGGVDPGEVLVSFTKADDGSGDTGQAGWAVDLPDRNKTVLDDGREMQEMSMERVRMMKAGNFVSAGPLYKNVLRIQYNAGPFTP